MPSGGPRRQIVPGGWDSFAGEVHGLAGVCAIISWCGFPPEVMPERPFTKRIRCGERYQTDEGYL